MTLIWIGLLIIGVAIVLTLVWDRPGRPSPPPGPSESVPPDPDVLDQPYDPHQAQDQQDDHPPPGRPGSGTDAEPYPGGTSNKAILALALAILTIAAGLTQYGFAYVELLAIVTIVCGHLGIRDTAGGHRRGRWMAVTALVLGYISALIALGFILFILLFVLA